MGTCPSATKDNQKAILSRVCGNYRQLTHDCSMHFIKTSALRDLILSAIREISTFVRSDEQEFSELQQAIFTQKQDYENPQRFIALVKRHTNFTELTTPMLNEFIEKVIVHEATGDRAHRKQKVDIYFNFIGNFVPPKQEPDAPTLTAEQQEVERKKEVRRDREREQNRLRMQRVRAAQKAALQAENMAKSVYILTGSLPHLVPQSAANSTRTATL